MALEKFRYLVYVILVDFNPAMFKFLMHKCKDEYPDDDDMPDDLESEFQNWEQNKDPLAPETIKDTIDKIIQDEVKGAETINQVDFVDVFYRQIIKIDVLPPSWEYAVWKVDDS